MNDPDDAILQRLSAALAVDDAVPDHVRAAARGAFAWTTIDAELAELTADTWELPLVGVRGDDDDRELSFQTDDVEIELLVQGDSARRVVGQVVASEPAHRATLEEPDGATRVVEVDALGRFTIADLADGPVRLVVVFTERRVQTPWFLT